MTVGPFSTGQGKYDEVQGPWRGLMPLIRQKHSVLNPSKNHFANVFMTQSQDLKHKFLNTDITDERCH